MTFEAREPAVAESYPTFWDEPSPAPVSLTVPAEDAYMVFVNLTEDDLPAAAPPDAD
jgi:hypothetical protein